MNYIKNNKIKKVLKLYKLKIVNIIHKLINLLQIQFKIKMNLLKTTQKNKILMINKKKLKGNPRKKL